MARPQAPPLAGDSQAIDPRALRAALALSRERMARLLDVSWKTVERVERMEASDRLPASATARLAAIRQIVDLGLSIYTPEGFAHLWRPSRARDAAGRRVRAPDAGRWCCYPQKMSRRQEAVAQASLTG